MQLRSSNIIQYIPQGRMVPHYRGNTLMSMLYYVFLVFFMIFLGVFGLISYVAVYIFYFGISSDFLI